MSYSKKIICLANSYKHPGGRCVAGLELRANGSRGQWIRPVTERGEGALSDSECRYADRTRPELLDIIEIHLERQEPVKHQVENHLIDSSKQWTKVGTFAWKDLARIVDEPPALWLNVDHTKSGLYDCIGPTDMVSVKTSLLFLHAGDLCIDVTSNYFRPRNDIRGKFSYKGVHHNFKVTDPIALDAFDKEALGSYPIGDAFLCISLTLPFYKDKRCYKLIAGIITNSPL